LSHYKLAKRGILGAGVVVDGRFFNEPNAILEFIDSCLASPTLRGWLDERAWDRIRAAVRARGRELACMTRRASSDKLADCRTTQGFVNLFVFA
jgi:hypothetical protein